MVMVQSLQTNSLDLNSIAYQEKREISLPTRPRSEVAERRWAALSLLQCFPELFARKGNGVFVPKSAASVSTGHNTNLLSVSVSVSVFVLGGLLCMFVILFFCPTVWYYSTFYVLQFSLQCCICLSSAQREGHNQYDIFYLLYVIKTIVHVHTLLLTIVSVYES